MAFNNGKGKIFSFVMEAYGEPFIFNFNSGIYKRIFCVDIILFLKL